MSPSTFLLVWYMLMNPITIIVQSSNFFSTRVSLQNPIVVLFLNHRFPIPLLFLSCHPGFLPAISTHGLVPVYFPTSCTSSFLFYTGRIISPVLYLSVIFVTCAVIQQHFPPPYSKSFSHYQHLPSVHKLHIGIDANTMDN